MFWKFSNGIFTTQVGVEGLSYVSRFVDFFTFSISEVVFCKGKTESKVSLWLLGAVATSTVQQDPQVHSSVSLCQL